MNKIIIVIFFLCVNATATAQQMSAAETIRNYSIPQKRLLAFSTFHFTNLITQYTLNQDSIMKMACRITGIPFLIAYNDFFPAGGNSVVTDLINSGCLDEAKKAVDLTRGEMRIEGLLEIAIWYLHKEGSYSHDLDSATVLIELATMASTNLANGAWRTECLFQLAELLYQKGKIKQSRHLLNQLLETARKDSNLLMNARANTLIADHFIAADYTKLNMYSQSLAIYDRLDLQEKQIELLWKMLACNGIKNLAEMEKNLREIMRLENKNNFKHYLYSKQVFAYVLCNKSDFLPALDNATAALKNMQWSGIKEVEGSFYMRMANAYQAFGKNEEALYWFKKTLNTASDETHLFWYKSFLYACSTLDDMGKPAEALLMIDSITKKFPPLTVWEQIQVSLTTGNCYVLLDDYKSADKYYTQCYKLAHNNPGTDAYGEMFIDYVTIAMFYVSQKNLEKVNLFRHLAFKNKNQDDVALYMKYQLYYKIDSLKGNYKSALLNHIKYKHHYDLSTNVDQRKKMDELTVKYAAEKKDQDIKLLKQQGLVQQTELKQNKLIRDIMVVGTISLLVIIGLLFSQYKLKQRTNAIMNTKNAALQHFVEEKQWLLKEVHHRVKNNLHTVISLLESQAAYLEDDALKAIQNSQHRIYAMSLIHQKLYQEENVKELDMSMYIPEFIRYLDESFDAHYRIHFELNIEAINLSISQAIPVALIINEAVTNSIKYAFPHNRKGAIQIGLYKVANQVTLEVSDDGVGIEHSQVGNASESLGLKLIKGLGEDIGGTVHINDYNGTTIRLVFNGDPLDQAKLISLVTEKVFF